jgi:pyridoxamine 5'-phosphate oxidase
MNADPHPQHPDIATLRREYLQNGLRRGDLTENPLDLFTRWLQQACDAHIPDPTAMCIATVDQQGQPYQRIVLLKNYNDDGFVFYTNYNSRKASHLASNPRVSLLFPWHMFERQVILLGKVEKLSVAESIAYFHSRPIDSQIAAWASHQSSSIANRQVLETRFFELKKKFQQGEIPYPDFWGGFRVRVDSVEFWQGGEHRLHDRFIYQRIDQTWQIERLSP